METLLSISLTQNKRSIFLWNPKLIWIVFLLHGFQIPICFKGKNEGRDVLAVPKWKWRGLGIGDWGLSKRGKKKDKRKRINQRQGIVPLRWNIKNDNVVEWTREKSGSNGDAQFCQKSELTASLLLIGEQGGSVSNIYGQYSSYPSQRLRFLPLTFQSY